MWLILQREAAAHGVLNTKSKNHQKLKVHAMLSKRVTQNTMGKLFDALKRGACMHMHRGDAGCASMQLLLYSSVRLIKQTWGSDDHLFIELTHTSHVKLDFEKFASVERQFFVLPPCTPSGAD